MGWAAERLASNTVMVAGIRAGKQFKAATWVPKGVHRIEMTTNPHGCCRRILRERWHCASSLEV